jgi:Ubiquitin carboxyl-terminal hydrolase
LSDAELVLRTLQEQFPLDEDEEPLGIDDRTIDTISALAMQAGREIEGAHNLFMLYQHLTFTEITRKESDLNQSITSNFTDMRKHGYRLHAAFFHRGTAGSGHYWIYIYDIKKELWRRYNDETVAEVTDTNEIFGPPPESQSTYKGYQSPANPYFLVYVRDDKKDELVEAVHRKIVQRDPPPVERSQMTEYPPDVEMSDEIFSEHHPYTDPTIHEPRPYTDPTIANYQGLFDTKKEGNWDNSSAHQPYQW